MSVDMTKYGEWIKGAPGNFGLEVRFDKSRGFVGITQRDDGGRVDRVLLSPAQYAALVKFASVPKRRSVSRASR